VPRDLVVNTALSSRARFLYIILASFADQAGVCWPGRALLCKLAGMSPIRSIALFANSGSGDMSKPVKSGRQGPSFRIPSTGFTRSRAPKLNPRTVTQKP